MFDNLATNNKQGQKNGQIGQDDQASTIPNSDQGSQFFGSPLQASAPDNKTSLANKSKETSTPLQASASIPPTKAIEDMFSDTDAQEKPAIFQPKEKLASINQVENMPPSQIDPYTGEQIKAKNKTIVFALMLISLMLVAILGWYAYRIFFVSMIETTSIIDKPAVDVTVDSAIIKEQEPAGSLIDNTDNSSLQIQDTDGDGLSDDEEQKLGTNPLEADTDGDGLFDKEEVKLYKTDPNNPDTDGDGYADGIEVHDNYNPNGEGKLYDRQQ